MWCCLETLWNETWLTVQSNFSLLRLVTRRLSAFWVFCVLRLKCENVLSSLYCFPDRETQGDGEESPEEESPVSRSSSDAPAQTGSKEVMKEEAGCFCVSILQKKTDFQLFIFSGQWSITKATPLWVNMQRRRWWPLIQTGKTPPGPGWQPLLPVSFCGVVTLRMGPWCFTSAARSSSSFCSQK